MGTEPEERKRTEMSADLLLRWASFFRTVATDLESSVQTMRDGQISSVEVTGYGTMRRGTGYVKSWLANVKSEVFELLVAAGPNAPDHQQAAKANSDRLAPPMASPEADDRAIADARSRHEKKPNSPVVPNTATTGQRERKRRKA